MRLTGYKAIEFAEATGLPLNRYAKPAQDVRQLLEISPDEARGTIAYTADPELIYIDEPMTGDSLVAELAKHMIATGVSDREGDVVPMTLHQERLASVIMYDYAKMVPNVRRRANYLIAELKANGVEGIGDGVFHALVEGMPTHEE